MGSVSGAGAEGFKNSNFLNLTNDQKKHWLYSAIDTLGFVAGHKNKKQGACVWHWYHQDISDKNGLILEYMKKYPESSPSAILIALTEKECGASVRN